MLKKLVTATMENAAIICPKIDKATITSPNCVTFALGWFWGPERTFRQIPGVLDAVCVYVGGQKEWPTYQAILDYTEGVTVLFDPDVIAFEDLFNVFLSKTSLTQCSTSRQYMSGVWWHNVLILIRKILYKQNFEKLKMIKGLKLVYIGLGLVMFIGLKNTIKNSLKRIIINSRL